MAIDGVCESKCECGFMDDKLITFSFSFSRIEILHRNYEKTFTPNALLKLGLSNVTCALYISKYICLYSLADFHICALFSFLFFLKLCFDFTSIKINKIHKKPIEVLPTHNVNPAVLTNHTHPCSSRPCCNRKKIVSSLVLRIFEQFFWIRLNVHLTHSI